MIKIKKFFNKNDKEINVQLVQLFHELFNLRMQAAHNQLQHTHMLKKIKRNIAKLKTIRCQKKIKEIQ